MDWSLRYTSAGLEYRVERDKVMVGLTFLLLFVDQLDPFVLDVLLDSSGM